MALREATCSLRASDPRTWNGVLRSYGVEVDDVDIACPQNCGSSWSRCPLCAPRLPAGRRRADVPRNEYGAPLIF